MKYFTLLNSNPFMTRESLEYFALVFSCYSMLNELNWKRKAKWLGNHNITYPSKPVYSVSRRNKRNRKPSSPLATGGHWILLVNWILFLTTHTVYIFYTKHMCENICSLLPYPNISLEFSIIQSKQFQGQYHKKWVFTQGHEGKH